MIMGDLNARIGPLCDFLDPKDKYSDINTGVNGVGCLKNRNAQDVTENSYGKRLCQICKESKICM